MTKPLLFKKSNLDDPVVDEEINGATDITK
jgi:hypothetical protein